MSDIIYLSLNQNTEVYKKDVLLKQLGTVYCSNKDIEKRCSELQVMHINKDEHVRITCSVMDVIELILAKEEDVQVMNLGESDFIIDYQPKAVKVGLWDWVKTIFVCVVIFFGGAFAIMAFNNDCSVSEIFSQIYMVVLGEKPEGASIVELSYSIGIPIGIMVFFNHFRKKQMSKDPTPLEVQMRSYESAVNDAIIKNAERKERGIDIT